VPISIALVDDGFAVFGIDASPAMVAAFRHRLPQAPVACEPVEDSPFFARTFDGILAWGLMFLLPAESQRALIARSASVLNPGGSFLFASPARPSTWADALTGRRSVSLGAEVYRAVLSSAGMVVVSEYLDEGGNYYYEAAKR